jgi:DNA-binding SARP family transcriptional activator
VIGETLASESAEATTTLWIYVAGGIALHGSAGRTVTEGAFAGRQARRLFVRLAASHEPVPQADLADDLWGTEWPASWQVSLRALISKLRTKLAIVGAAEAIVHRDNGYTLRLPAGTWFDLDAAAEMIHRAEILQPQDPAAACGWALGARAVASRPVLPGEEGEWLDTIRQRLVEIRLRSLECLGEIWISRGDPSLATRDAAEAIAVDPYRETAHRLLIRAHLAAGDRGAAVAAFEACRATLAMDLGVKPSPQTLALVSPLIGRSGAG